MEDDEFPRWLCHLYKDGVVTLRTYLLDLLLEGLEDKVLVHVCLAELFLSLPIEKKNWVKLNIDLVINGKTIKINQDSLMN